MGSVNRSSRLFEMLEDIKEAGERSARLTSQILAFALKQPVDPEVMEIMPEEYVVLSVHDDGCGMSDNTRKNILSHFLPQNRLESGQGPFCKPPQEAVQQAESNNEEIQLLVTDVTMPDMNDTELAEKITSLHPEVKILFMSGYPADIVANQGILCENVQFCRNPFYERTWRRK